MYQRVTLILTVALLLSAAVLAQNPITADSPYQVKVFPNLSTGAGGSVINITNTGGNNYADICVNTFVYDGEPDEQLVACCACQLTPNEARGLDVVTDLINNTLTPRVPTRAVVKLVATSVPAGGCNAAAPGAPAVGMAAWGTNIHVGGPTGVAMTETAFTPSTLSPGEISHSALFCGFIQANGSGFGICTPCRATSLGGVKR